MSQHFFIVGAVGDLEPEFWATPTGQSKKKEACRSTVIEEWPSDVDFL